MKCIEIHPHKIKEVMNIDNLISDFLKKYEEKQKLNEGLKKEENIEITKNLCEIYIYNKKNKLFNGYIYEILCKLLNIDIIDMKKDILFNKFNDEEFRKYYSKLIEGIEEGNRYFLNCLDNIKPFYKKRIKRNLNIMNQYL